MKNLVRGLFPVALLALMFMAACNSDDDEVTGGGGATGPVASFQFEIDGFQVTFSNFSQNASSYSWDFGDGNSSTEENPVHTYDGGGSYAVTLTATDDAGETATRTQTINITDPDLLTGSGSKTWYLLREGIAMGVGPAQGDTQWFAFGNAANPLGDRPCILDDEYTFSADGTFQNDTKGTLYIDGETNWKASAGCFDESDPSIWDNPDGEDPSAFGNGGDYTYTFDEGAGTLTIEGLGAYIGLATKSSNGDSYVPEASKTYQVGKLVAGDIADTLVLYFEGGTGIWWTFNLVAYDDPNDLPPIPASEPRADFSFNAAGLEVTFNNMSANATSYTWDFGDGSATSSEENPVHSYATDGSYEVTLTASDGSSTDQITKTVTVVSSLPTPTSMGHTFESAAGADLLANVYGGSTINLGVADPAGGSTPVGEFIRVAGVQFQEAKLSFDPPSDIDFANLTTISMEVYIPSSNDYTNLTRAVVLGIANEHLPDNPNWWQDPIQYDRTLDASEMDQWVTLTYNLDAPTSGNQIDPKTVTNRDMIFINIGGGGHGDGGTFYIRNLKFE